MQKNPSIRQTHFIGVLLPDERAARAQRREIHDGCVDAFDVADPDRAELRSRLDDACGCDVQPDRHGCRLDCVRHRVRNTVQAREVGETRRSVTARALCPPPLYACTKQRSLP